MNKSFEKKLDELDALVKELESGNVDLDDAINKYSEAMKLLKTCEDELKSAQDTVAQIVKETGLLENFEVNNEKDD